MSIIFCTLLFGAWFAWSRRWRLIASLLVTLSVLLLLSDGGRFPASRTKVDQAKCVVNLRQLAEAKRSWATLTKPETTTAPQPSDLAQYLKQGLLPLCPAGGTYTLGAVHEPPRCSLAHQGHKFLPPR
jgi:hypothetical protein